MTGWGIPASFLPILSTKVYRFPTYARWVVGKGAWNPISMDASCTCNQVVDLLLIIVNNHSRKTFKNNRVSFPTLLKGFEH